MPQPTTTGGNMGYPASVDTGQIQPFALYDGEPGAAGSSVLVINTVFLVGTVLAAPAVITGVTAVFAAGGAGHYDVGIYDASGANGAPNNLLAHAAATATSLVTATGQVSPAFIGGNLSLSSGRYWLAFWIDNATDTVYRISSPTSANVVALSGTNAGPLPALASSITSIVDQNKKLALVAKIVGSWS